MKKLLPLILVLTILTGCGSNTMSQEADFSVQTENAEEALDSAKESVTESITETASPIDEYAVGELKTITLNISYTSDATPSEMYFNFFDDEYDYFSSDLSGVDNQRCGMEKKPKTLDHSNELIFTGDTAEATDKIFNDLYASLIEPNTGVIEDAFYEIAQKSKEEKYYSTTSDKKLDRVDLTALMPDTLTLTIDGNTISLNIIQTQVNGTRWAECDTEPTDSPIPYFLDDKGRYRYLEHIRVGFTVPTDQMSPLYDYFNAAKAEEEQKPAEQREQYLAEINTDSDSENSTESVNNTIADTPVTDLTGTWYDPTKYNTAEFTFNGDGTGSINWGSSTDSYTYTIDGNNISCALENHTITITIASSDSLSYGGSKYIKKE